MKFEEYRQFDAMGLAELVARGEVSAAELLGTAIARAEQVNPSLNAQRSLNALARCCLRRAIALYPRCRSFALSDGICNKAVVTDRVAAMS